MPEIGIAITTTDKRKVHDNYDFMSRNDALVYVHLDKEKIGVPASKNRCIKHLYDAGCKYIFLFDDDCYPIRGGWEDFVINVHEKTGIHHFCYLEPTHHTAVKDQSYDGITVTDYLNCGGVFIFLTREVIDKVGYANTKYNRWGFWHAAYSHRIWKSGLMSKSFKYCSIPGISNYLLSEDYLNMRITPNLNKEEKEILIAHNKPIFQEEINSKQIYYPFS